MSRVQSIERAFAVLSALADGPIGVTEVAQRVGVPKSTAARLLTALWHEGAVEQEAGGTRYRLGPRIADLATRHVPTRDLVGVARPHLVELATAAGEVAGLSVPDGRVAHYVDQVGTAHEVQVRDWTGSRVPMHAVPSGQVMLAGLAPAALERFLATPLEAFTPATVTDPEILRSRLRDVLRGKLSLVGIRPARTNDRWLCKEGVISLADLSSGASAPLGSDDVEQMNLYYARHHTFGMDMEILLRSIFARQGG